MDAQEIHNLRQRLGLTQGEFARRAGASTRAVEEWESGRRSPRGLYLRALESLKARADRAERKES